MNYIYDIFINFNEEFYDFFDWNCCDDICHIRKIPLFRVKSKILEIIKHNYVKFDEEFLNKIKDKTEKFENRKVNVLTHAFLLTDGVELLGFKLEENINKYISKLSIDEEIEVLDICERLDEIDIAFEIIKPKKINELVTRNDKNMVKFIQKEIKMLDNKKDLEKLKYLYYDCFGKKENNKSKIIIDINKSLNTYDEKKYIKIYSFLKLTSVKRKKTIDLN